MYVLSHLSLSYTSFAIFRTLNIYNTYNTYNIASRDNESPLIQACHRGHHEIVRHLLRAPNIKINQKRKTDGATALFVACREGATQCVRHLLSNDLLFINESKTNGRSPLFIASFFGHNEIVQMLITHSHRMQKARMHHGILDVNQCDSKGFTPLFVAAQNGHTQIVTLLLKNKVCFVMLYCDNAIIRLYIQYDIIIYRLMLIKLNKEDILHYGYLHYVDMLKLFVYYYHIQILILIIKI